MAQQDLQAMLLGILIFFAYSMIVFASKAFLIRAQKPRQASRLFLTWIVSAWIGLLIYTLRFNVYLQEGGIVWKILGLYVGLALLTASLVLMALVVYMPKKYYYTQGRKVKIMGIISFALGILGGLVSVITLLTV
ncbi:MAG: hypothetical protein AAB443_03270 [Patescibacteria group bacterium]